MSRVIECPRCHGPMDVPAYPGDGVYRTHWCPAQWPVAKEPERDTNYGEAEEW